MTNKEAKTKIFLIFATLSVLALMAMIIK